MLKSYKYRLYPTKKQADLLDKHFNACRFVYNLALETKIRAYNDYKKNITKYDLINQLSVLKQECVWLKEVDSQALQQVMYNIDLAFVYFFKYGALFPKFKHKNTKQAYRTPHGDRVKIKDGRLCIPKFITGIKYIKDSELEGTVKNATISKTPTGKYFAKILVDTGELIPDKKPILQDTAVGIDLGIKTFAVLSNGQEIANPKHLKASAERLAVLQRRASRKQKGSANRRKANLKVALLHEKIANQRKDFLHKLSTQLVNNHDTLCLEDLNIAGMVKNHNLSRSISDASWSEFNRQLEYKANWYGKNILRIGRFEPSSKTCNVCGLINKDLKLSHREWTCECGEVHDRDLNAAINIKNIALSGEAFPVGLVELPTMDGAVKQEANTNKYSYA